MLESVSSADKSAAAFRPRPLPPKPAPCARGRGVAPVEQAAVTDRQAAAAAAAAACSGIRRQQHRRTDQVRSLTLPYKQSPASQSILSCLFEQIVHI